MKMKDYSAELIAKMERIFRNTPKKSCNCMISNCNKKTIFSHFAPQSKWLKNIDKQGKYYCIERTNSFYTDRFPLSLTEKGIKEVMGIHLFCQEHDSSIFKNIEAENVDYNDYRTQTLLCYRTVCACIRQCDVNIEIFKKIELISQLNAEIEIKLENSIKTTYIDYKDFLWSEYKNNSANMEFKLFRFEKIDVCISNICYYENDVKVEGKDYQPCFIVNVFPINENETGVLIGYVKVEKSNMIQDYLNLWYKPLSFKEILTYHMISFPENWVISKTLYDSISKSKINQFEKFVTNRNEFIKADNFSLFD